MTLDHPGEIANPFQRLPGLLGAVTGEQQGEVGAADGRDPAIPDHDLRRIVPDIVRSKGERHVRSAEGPMQVDLDVAVGARESVLTLADEEGPPERRVALGIAVAQLGEQPFGIPDSRGRHDDVDIVALAGGEAAVEGFRERHALEGHERYRLLGEGTGHAPKFLREGQRAQQMAMLEGLQGLPRLSRDRLPRQVAEVAKQARPDAVMFRKRDEMERVDACVKDIADAAQVRLRPCRQAQQPELEGPHSIIRHRHPPWY